MTVASRYCVFLLILTQWIIMDIGRIQQDRKVGSIPLQLVRFVLLRRTVFLLHINDLPNCVSFQVRLFADDCRVYRTVNSVQDQLQLQQDLDSLADWASCWSMSFNRSKCTIITISRSISPLHKFYTLCGVVLQHVTEARYVSE